MTQEEKAQRYDEAIEGIQEILSSGADSIKMSRLQLRLQGFFPELKESKDVLAYLMLRVIVYALNEGWQPRFTQDEYRWYPWYYVKSKEEVEAMSEEQRRRVCGRSYYNAYAIGGLAYAFAYYASSFSYASYGSRLAFKTEELAEYAGKQFGEVYARMILG